MLWDSLTLNKHEIWAIPFSHTPPSLLPPPPAAASSWKPAQLAPFSRAGIELSGRPEPNWFCHRVVKRWINYGGRVSLTDKLGLILSLFWWLPPFSSTLHPPSSPHEQASHRHCSTKAWTPSGSSLPDIKTDFQNIMFFILFAFYVKYWIIKHYLMKPCEKFWTVGQENKQFKYVNLFYRPNDQENIWWINRK